MELESQSDQRRESTGAFVTTQWTRVLSARGKTPEAFKALSELCAAYYAPVVAFLRCSGNEEELARELAHEFFARLLEHGGFDRVERGRARFRSYLLGAVKNFVSDARKRRRAAKRGGHHPHLSVEPGTDTSPGLDLPDARCRTPEQEFDRQWALTTLERSLKQLAIESRAEGRAEHYTVLKPWLIGETEGLSQAEAAARLSMTEGAVKVAIHRLRKRFRELVKADLGQTVAHPAQVDEELRNLIAALR
jgi:RNA polymerase sigma factor (sigma-70 family)